MQEEFKERILSYLVGDYQTESGNNTLTGYLGKQATGDNAFEEINDMGGTYYGIAKSKDGQYLAIYGSYDSETKGFIALCKNNFELIEIFTQYEGGTNLPVIYYLNAAEDGTFFGISKQNNQLYLLMLNNFTLTLGDTYVVKFRQSYVLDGDLQNALFLYRGAKVFKKINEAKYCFISPLEITTYTGNSTYYRITKFIVSFLEIQVGAENIWSHNITNCSVWIDGLSYQYSNRTRSFDTYATWTDNNYYVKIAGQTGNTQITEFSLNNNTTFETTVYTIPHWIILSESLLWCRGLSFA